MRRRCSAWLASSWIAMLGAACGGTTENPGGPGGAGGAGGGGGSGAGGASCGADVVGLEGTLDGADVAASYPFNNRGFRGALYKAFFGDQGKVFLDGEEAIVTNGGTTGATGFFRMPGEGPSPGLWLCAGGGSDVTYDKTIDPARTAFTLASLARLGACPGAPVAGEVTACLSSDAGFCPLGTSFEGTLDGVPFDYGDFVSGWGGSISVYEVFLENGAVIALDIQQDTVLGGVLRLPPDAPDPGGIYCVGSGSMIPGPNTSIEITLGGLSRLGTCPEATPASGALIGCAP